MNKILISFLLSLMLSSLQANDEIFISPKVSLKMIGNQGITFISLENSTLKIKKSKTLNMNTLKPLNILGRMDCSPFYVCTKEVEEYFSTLGIDRKEALIIYDDVYGINAATLYVVLESMGHKKMSILRGGVRDVLKLDPNWKIYTDYLNELKIKELNQTSLKVHIVKIEKIRKKINILKPHLLLENIKDSKVENIESNYTVNNTDVKYLISREELIEGIREVRNKESNITIIDACEMIDIVKRDNSPYMSGVKSLSWKKLIDKNKKNLKANEALEKLFMKLNLDKNDTHYIYCMSGAQKAFYLMMALREVGYSKVKVFTGDWNTWIGDIDE